MSWRDKSKPKRKRPSKAARTGYLLNTNEICLQIRDRRRSSRVRKVK